VFEIPYGNIVTAIATVLAVVVANRLSYRQSNKERLWDLRRVTYGTILSELALVQRICNSIDEAISERSYEEYWNTKSRVRDDDELHERMKTITSRVSDDYLILSDTFIKAYSEFTDAMRADPYNSSPPNEHDVFSAAVREHRPRLMKIARDEMQVKTNLRIPFT
jgi:hypothetical protein